MKKKSRTSTAIPSLVLAVLIGGAATVQASEDGSPAGTQSTAETQVPGDTQPVERPNVEPPARDDEPLMDRGTGGTEAARSSATAGPDQLYDEAMRDFRAANYEAARDQLHHMLGAFDDDIEMRSSVRINLVRARLALQDREGTLAATQNESSTSGSSTSDGSASALDSGDEADAATHSPMRLMIDEVIEMVPSSADAWNVKGHVLLHEGNIEGAQKAFEEAVFLDGSHIYAKNNLAYVHIQRGEYETAARHLNEAWEIAQSQEIEVPPYLYNNLGVALEHTGSANEAHDAYLHAATLGSHNAKANLSRLQEQVPASESTAERMMQGNARDQTPQLQRGASPEQPAIEAEPFEPAPSQEAAPAEAAPENEAPRHEATSSEDATPASAAEESGADFE